MKKNKKHILTDKKTILKLEPSNAIIVQKIKSKRILTASVSDFVNNWTVTPSGTEGYKTAEVTRGGIDTKEISSSTMECKNFPGLYFIGEVLDVTGHLGGHNFQWAWSSGFVAGQNV